MAADSKALSVIGANADTAMQFINTVKSSLMIEGLNQQQRESAGLVVAMQMVTEQMTLAEIRQKYHVYVDRLNYRSEWVHAELERRGWDWDWEADGEDKKTATLVGIKNGKKRRSTFTIQMANAKDLVKRGSNWDKDPAEMLRARAITRFATMWEPSIGAGVQSDAEASDAVQATVVESSEVTSSTVTPASQVEEAVAVPEAAAEKKDTPPPTTDDPQTKPVTRDSMISALDFPKRAFTAFAKEPKITYIRDLLKLTYDQLCEREGLGVGTADKVVEVVSAAGYKMAEPESNEDPGPDVQQHDPKSGEPPSNSDHGIARETVREICRADGDAKVAAIEKIGEFWPGKTSLTDLDSLQTHLLLVYVLAFQAGKADKFAGAREVIEKDPHPIDRAKANIEQLTKALGKK